jgi:c-di-GMP-binding flagellar brake protein YcgR
MKDRRRYERIVIKGLDIECKMQFVAEVKLLNISFSGAAISLDRRLHIGREYTLHFERADKMLTLKGKVVWEKLAGTDKTEKGDVIPIYNAGIQFDNVLTEKATEIIKFIQANMPKKQVNKRLQGLRIQIVEPDRGYVSGLSGGYQVVKISLGGMLIESEHKFDVESKLKMEMSLSKKEEPIRFVGRIASCITRSTKTPMIYETGVEFLDMIEEDKQRLKQFINNLQK